MTIGWEHLAGAGIPLPEYIVTTDFDSAVAFRNDLASRGVVRVCVKAHTNEHKAAHGLVQLDVTSDEELAAAWSNVMRRQEQIGLGGYLVIQEQIGAGLEFMVGGVRDSVFGPAVMFGVGGRLVEVIDRQVIRLCPVTEASAEAMVASVLGGVALSDGVGRQLAAVITGVSALLSEHEDVQEIDLNPLIVSGDRVLAVDLRVRTGTLPESDRSRGRAASAEAAIASILSPSSVAIIGVSSDPSKPARRALRYLRKYSPQTTVYGVNPKGGSVDGLELLTSPEQLPGGVATAVIATPRESVIASIESCAKAGIGSFVVFAGGYGEAGDCAAETSVIEAAHRLGVRICGVNTIGVVGDVPLTFTQAMEFEPKRGDVSFVTQSGAIGGSLLLRAWTQGLGTARFVCVGNQTDLSVADYVRFLATDEATRVVGMFLEGVTDGLDFRQALQAFARSRKPLVVVRAGASDVGAAAARSHTGTLAGSARIYRAALEESGCILARDLAEMVAMCQALAWQPIANGNRVAVISTSGGACSLVADLLRDRNLAVPELEPAIQDRLREVLPYYAPTRNPLDTTGQIVQDPHLLFKMAVPVLESEAVDVLLVTVTTTVGDHAVAIAEDVARLSQDSAKPIVVGWTLTEQIVPEAYAILRAARVPVFDSFDLATAATEALVTKGRQSQGMTQTYLKSTGVAI